jgi:hypothetical protein
MFNNLRSAEMKSKIDFKNPDFKPDFGYTQSKTKKECSNPEFAMHNLHRLAIMKKEHFGSKGDRDENGLKGWTVKGICMGCGKTFKLSGFYPEGLYERGLI